MNVIQHGGDLVTAPTALARSQRAEMAKAARREEILGAARRVFSERGFKGTTIADIAEEARIALGTVYLYFPSKEDLFAALSQRFSELLTSTIRADVPGDSLEESIRGRIRNVFEFCGANRDLVRLVVLNTDADSRAAKRMRASSHDHYRPLVEAFAEGARQGLSRDADPVIMTQLTVGLVSIAVYQAFVLSDGSQADKLQDECAEMIIAYLRPAGNQA
jgi:AcrR family transcriptional regulator